MTGYKIVAIDLSQPLPHLTDSPQPIYGIFGWHDIPLGSTVIHLADLPLSTAALATLAAQTVMPAVRCYLELTASTAPMDWTTLTNLLAPLDQISLAPSDGEESGKKQTVSVVVCTRNRPEHLEHCLKSLQSLSPPADEIIVVDNAPHDQATHDLVQHVDTAKDTVRYVLEPKPGLSIARNTGIMHSQSDIIAFTDDDVCVHPHWLNHLRTALYDKQVMAVTGSVLPTKLETESEILFELSYGYLNNGYQPKTFDNNFFKQHQHQGIPVWDIGAGANMAFRRQVFNDVGNFDPRLGAGAAGCSEDSELWYRILAAGWHCQYVPAAVVYHTHRQNTSALRKQMKAYMQGHVVALLIQYAQFKHSGNLWRLLVVLPSNYWRHLKKAIRQRFQAQYATYWAELLGYLTGLPAYLRLTYFSLSQD